MKVVVANPDSGGPRACASTPARPARSPSVPLRRGAARTTARDGDGHVGMPLPPPDEPPREGSGPERIAARPRAAPRAAASAGRRRGASSSTSGCASSAATSTSSGAAAIGGATTSGAATAGAAWTTSSAGRAGTASASTTARSSSAAGRRSATSATAAALPAVPCSAARPGCVSGGATLADPTSSCARTAKAVLDFPAAVDELRCAGSLLTRGRTVRADTSGPHRNSPPKRRAPITAWRRPRTLDGPEGLRSCLLASRRRHPGVTDIRCETGHGTRPGGERKLTPALASATLSPTSWRPQPGPTSLPTPATTTSRARWRGSTSCWAARSTWRESSTEPTPPRIRIAGCSSATTSRRGCWREIRACRSWPGCRARSPLTTGRCAGCATRSACRTSTWRSASSRSRPSSTSAMSGCSATCRTTSRGAARPPTSRSTSSARAAQRSSRAASGSRPTRRSSATAC